MDDIKINVLHRDYIYVYDGADAPVTGLVLGNFTVRVTVDGAIATTAVAIAEVDATNRPGLYQVSFTPDVKGYWYVHVIHATYNTVGWQGYYQVVDQEYLGVGNRTVTVMVKDADSLVVIPSVLVEVFNSDQTVKVALGFTNASGQVVFSLYDGTHKVILSKVGSYTFTNPQTLVVSAAASVAYTGTAFSPTAPAASGLCVVYGWERDAGGEGAAVVVRAEIMASTHFLNTNPHVVRGPIEVTSDAGDDGSWEIPLTRSDQYVDDDVTYKFTIDKVPMGDYEVPALASVAFKVMVTGS